MISTSPFSTVPFASLPGLDNGAIFANFDMETSLDVSSEFFVYLSSDNYTTLSTDSPDFQPFIDSLYQPMQFRRSILNDDGFGGFIEAQGEMSVVNSDGSFDYLPERWTLEGTEVDIRYGRRTDPYALFQNVFTGVAGVEHVGRGELRIPLYDYGFKLDVPMETSLYAGTGGAEGSDDLKGKRRPGCWGYVRHVSPVLLVSNKFIYQVHNGAVESIEAFNNGAALTFGADFATYALLDAAVTAAGHYYTCLAEGYVRINDLSDNETLTCDVEGDSGGGFVGTVGTLIRRIIEGRTVISAVTGFFDLAFEDFEDVHPYEAGIYTDQNDTSTVRDIVTRLAGYGVYLGFRRDGRFTIGRFDAPAAAIKIRLTETDIFDIERDPLPSGLRPPPHRWRVPYAHCFTMLGSNIAGSVSASMRSFLAEADRFATAESAAIKRNHPFGKDRDPVTSYLRNEADAQAEADRFLLLNSIPRSTYRITFDRKAHVLDIGSELEVTYDRWDLSAGKNLVVVDLEENARDNRCTAIGYG